MKYGPLLFLSFFLYSNSQAHASKDLDVIYGEDNRKDHYEVKSPLHLRLAESTAALVSAERLVSRGNSIELTNISLKEFRPIGYPVCEKEKFSSQPVISHCSGFLVGDDLLVTAGHCMLSESDCTNNRWVFNYKVNDPYQTDVNVDPSDVYRCKKVIKTGLDPKSKNDFALVQLDRPNKGKALKIAKEIPKKGTPLLMIGHPSGLPQKFTDNAKITAVHGNYFVSDLDAFGGNSGSAVFNANTGEILGILASGNVDYILNTNLMCAEVNVLSSSRAGEIISSFKQFDSFLDIKN